MASNQENNDSDNDSPGDTYDWNGKNLLFNDPPSKFNQSEDPSLVKSIADSKNINGQQDLTSKSTSLKSDVTGTHLPTQNSDKQNEDCSSSCRVYDTAKRNFDQPTNHGTNTVSENDLNVNSAGDEDRQVANKISNAANSTKTAEKILEREHAGSSYQGNGSSDSKQTERPLGKSSSIKNEKLTDIKPKGEKLNPAVSSKTQSTSNQNQATVNPSDVPSTHKQEKTYAEGGQTNDQLTDHFRTLDNQSDDPSHTTENPPIHSVEYDREVVGSDVNVTVAPQSSLENQNLKQSLDKEEELMRENSSSQGDVKTKTPTKDESVMAKEVVKVDTERNGNIPQKTSAPDLDGARSSLALSPTKSDTKDEEQQNNNPNISPCQSVSTSVNLTENGSSAAEQHTQQTLKNMAEGFRKVLEKFDVLHQDKIKREELINELTQHVSEQLEKSIEMETLDRDMEGSSKSRRNEKGSSKKSTVRASPPNEGSNTQKGKSRPSQHQQFQEIVNIPFLKFMQISTHKKSSIKIFAEQYTVTVEEKSHGFQLKGEEDNLKIVGDELRKLVDEIETKQLITSEVEVLAADDFSALKSLSQDGKCCIMHSPTWITGAVEISVLCCEAKEIDKSTLAYPVDTVAEDESNGDTNEESNFLTFKMPPESEKQKYIHAYEDSLKSLFKKANGKDISSLSFPIEAFKKYPKLKYKVLVKGITVALKDFQGEMNGMPRLRNVILCSDETEPCEELKRILTDASPKYVNSQPIKISTVVGKITEQKVDVLVNTISSDLNLQYGAVAKSVYNAAGHGIQQELSNLHGTQIKYGQVAVTKGFKLQCKHVYHGALLGWDKEKGESKKVLQRFVQSCLHHMDFYGHKTIAFPVLGAGNLKIPVQVVAPVMRKTIEDHRKLHPETKITEVKIVCLGDLDKEFREALKLEEPGPHFEMCVENTTTHLTVGSVDPPLIDAYDAIVVLWTKDNMFKVSAHHSKIQGKDWSTRRRKTIQEKGLEVTKRDYGKMTINFLVKDENTLEEIEMALKRAKEEGCSRVCIEVRSSDPLAKDCKKFALSVLNAVKKLQKFGLEEVRLNFDQKSLMTSACQALQGPAAVVTTSRNLSLEITGKKSDVAAVRKRLQDFLTVKNKQTQEDVAEPPQQAIPRDLPQNVNESKGAIPKTSELLKKGEQTKRDKLMRTKEEECCVILSFKKSPTKSFPQQTDADIKAKLTSEFQKRREVLLIVYPFNSPQKALIKCKSAEDACSLLRTFKHEAYELKEFQAQALNDLEAKLTQPVIDLIQQCGLNCDEIEANCGAVLDKQQWVLTGNLLEIQAAHSYLKTRLQAERRKDSKSEVSRKTENSHHLQTSDAAAMQKKYLCLSNEDIKIMKHFFKDLPFDKVSQNFVSENEISISGNQMNISKFENALESIQNFPVAELNVCQTEFHTLEREIPTHDDFMLQFIKIDQKVIVLGKNQEQVRAVKDQMVTVLQRQKPQSPGPSMLKGSKNKNFPEGHVAFFPIDELSYDVFRSMHGKDKSYEGKLELKKDENSQLQMQVLPEKVDDFMNDIGEIKTMSKSYVDVDLAVNNLQHVQQQCPDVLISLLYADKIIVVAKSSQELKATEDALMKVLRSQYVTVFSGPVIKHFCKSANQNIISVSSQGTHNTIVTGPKGVVKKIEEEMKALEVMRETYIGLKDVWDDTVVNYLYDKGRSQDNLYVHVDRKQRIVHVCGTERDVSDMMKYIEDNKWHHVGRSSTVPQIKKLNITISEGDFLSVHSEGIVNPMDEKKVESDILVYAGEEVKTKVLQCRNVKKDHAIPTDAGSLKQHGAEVIFHVFVPRWLGFQADTVAFKGELFEILKMCFSEAKKSKISSLVIPSFGKVHTHAPDIVCATTYAECVKEFSRAYTGSLKDIHFVDSTGEMFDLMNAAFQQPLPWIFRKPDGECQYHLSHQMVVKVTDGDILGVKADALVVREDPECKSTSYPAKVFTAGKRFPENYSKQVKKLKEKYMNLRQGDIHHLDMKIGGPKIFLAIMPDQFKHYIDYNSYKSCMKNVLQKLCDTGIKTVALPFFGGGGRDKKKCAELLVGELHDFSKSTKQRPIVVHIQDKVENLQLIHDEFQSCFHKDKALGDVWQRNAEVLVLPPP